MASMPNGQLVKCHSLRDINSYPFTRPIYRSSWTSHYTNFYTPIRRWGDESTKFDNYNWGGYFYKRPDYFSQPYVHPWRNFYYSDRSFAWRWRPLYYDNQTPCFYGNKPYYFF
ncbi:hypothetical protein M3Y97_00884100 [Aphelenchoides bicaudatus]|nr:hypothetical protein M3Y97_00884100 [Aphelenchoides bicaudatus]